ncbi:hypothetical protein KL867_19310 [Ruegeria litorea]|uniref:Uncharacterized protein n=1 Tax=Falsiruegeria litorea TaxID=1280831 RepID=A0ABS5WXE8_9RHOB|nr:hypothetical protein [Falsiruegeria litorea]MBT3143218.1 hypothetical protein [Falsiruegeria litorea]
MARRKSSYKKKPSRVRRTYGSRRSSSNLGWYIAIGVCVLVIVGVFVGSQTLISNSKVNEATLCHTDGPVNVTAILLDLTDPLSNTQQIRLKTIIENEIASSSTDTMISLGVVSEEPQRWGSLFAKCKPATGEQANALYENPSLIADRYQREFLIPISDKIDATLVGQAESQSPIMEALQSLIASTPDFTRARGQRKFVIVSDMLQHSDTLSFYRNQGWEYFSSRDGELRLAANLQNVSIEIMRIPRSGNNIPSRELVENFWTRYFDRQGSKVPSVSSMGDL